MGHKCCVFGCNVRTHDRDGNKLEHGISFHGFPTWKKRQGGIVSEVTKRRRLAWIAAVRRTDLHFSHIPNHMKVCSRHFHFGKPAYEMDETNPDWVPTLHMGHSKMPAPHRLLWKLQQMKQSAEVGSEHKTDGAQTERDEEAKRPKVECEFCGQSTSEINQLLEVYRDFRSDLKKKELNEDFLKNDDDRVRHYTGLPCFDILFSLFSMVKSFFPAAKKLSHFQMLLLTLMRLRLDITVQHLCHLFNVSHKTLCSAFVDTIHVLHAHLGPLVHWPERHCLQATMPHQFIESFGKCVAIIVYSFEIHTETHSSLKARAQTYSHHKGTHTMKYLIGITPQGSVSFISKGWGGRAPDKYIMEKCGLLNKLLPGDVVLADRGFDIRDAVGMMCAEIKTPSFTKGFCQLDVKDIEDTRAVAHLRVHVERVIRSMRNKYKILHATMPIRLLVQCEGEELTLLDKIVNVCCSLVNMCPS